ncbi:unnamed protein product, partial [Polarella glacialis]
CGETGDDSQLPPALVVAFVQLLQSWLPERLAADLDRFPALMYERCLHIDGAARRGAEASLGGRGGSSGGSSEVSRWLSEKMGLNTSDFASLGDVDLQVADGGCSAADVLDMMHARLAASATSSSPPSSAASVHTLPRYDLVLVELCPEMPGHNWHEVAWAEFESEFRHRALLSVLLALRVLGPGGDLFVQLPSLYSRFFAGVVILLAAAFSRIAIARPPIVPSWRGGCWLLCSGFASSTRGSAVAPVVQSLLVALWSRLRSASPGRSVAQVVPSSFLCADAGGIRQFFVAANDEVIDAELRFWSSWPRTRSVGPGQRRSETGTILHHLTELGIKQYLYAGPAHRFLVGIYFGTFDPFHENHFRLVLC